MTLTRSQVLRIFIFMMSFISAIPTLLTWHCLNLWLASLGYSPLFLASLSLMGLPFSFKLIITPFLEHCSLPGFNASKHWQGWLVISSIVLSLGILTLGLIAEHSSKEILIIVGLAINLGTIVFQSAFYFLKLELVNNEELTSGLFVQRLGFKAGHTLCEGILILIAHFNGWTAAYTLCGIIFLSCTCFLSYSPWLNKLLKQQPVQSAKPPFCFNQIAEVLKSYPLIFLLAFLLNIGDDFIGPLVNTYYLYCGYDQLMIVSIAKFWGTVCMITGGAAALLALAHASLLALLWVSTFCHALSLSFFPILKLSMGSYIYFSLFICFKSFTLGFKSLVAARYFVEHIRQAKHKTLVYALIASMKSLALSLCFFSGVWYTVYGWTSLFTFNALLAAPALSILSKLNRPKVPITIS